MSQAMTESARVPFRRPSSLCDIESAAVAELAEFLLLKTSNHYAWRFPRANGLCGAFAPATWLWGSEPH